MTVGARALRRGPGHGRPRRAASSADVGGPRYAEHMDEKALDIFSAARARRDVGRIREALRYVDAERLWIAPDCGMKYHSREHSQAKLKAMVDGTALVRAELT